MNSIAKVAVIIPAYNAAGTLAVTVESVLAQTLSDMEIWIVDDGSSDDTGMLADGIAVRDSRVHVIHQENQGAYMARVNALKATNAEYFAFVDADDTIEPTMYERMYGFAREHDLDVVQCGSFGAKTGVQELILGRENVVNNLVKPWLFEGRGGAYLWDKIYRREMADVEICHLRTSVFEDLILNLCFFKKVARVGFLHERLYRYSPNANSTTRNFNDRNIKGFLETIRYRRAIAPEYGMEPSSHLFSKWILLNAGNLVRQATLAVAPSLAVRISNVKAILDIEDVRDAMSRAPNAAKFLKRVMRCPTMYVLKTRFVAWMMNCILDIRRWAYEG